MNPSSRFALLLSVVVAAVGAASVGKSQDGSGVSAGYLLGGTNLTAIADAAASLPVSLLALLLYIYNSLSFPSPIEHQRKQCEFFFGCFRGERGISRCSLHEQTHLPHLPSSIITNNGHHVHLRAYSCSSFSSLAFFFGSLHSSSPLLLQINRIYLAFVSPTMYYVPGSKTLAGAGFDGFADPTAKDHGFVAKHQAS